MSFPCLVAALLGIALWMPQRAWAATAAGTVLSASTAATYQDLAGSTYATTSNTVTTTVANSPVLTVSTPTGQSVTPGMMVVDTFTLTNMGNAAGNFGVAADATFGGTLSSPNFYGYVLNGASGTCTTASPCMLTTATTGLQAKLAAQAATPIGGTITIGVMYTVGTGAATNQTAQATLTPTITYPLAGGTAAATSASVGGTSTDTVVPDARLDIAASASQPTSGALNITWTITANNGGGFPASDSAAVKTLLSGSTPGGIAVVAQVPTYSGTALALQGTPTCTLNGASSGATATMFYTVTTATPSAGNWGTTSTGGTTAWLACYIHGGASGAELPSAPTGSIGAGSVMTPQVTLTFVTLPPGSSTLGIVTNIANGWANGAVWATGAYPVIGPGITLGTADGTGVSLHTATTEGNTTPSAGTVPPGGASNVSASQAYIAPTGSTTTGTAMYVGADTTTLGAWHAASTPWTPYVYGSDGYTILDGTAGNTTLGTHNPAYAVVTLGGNSGTTVFAASGTTDTRAPYQSSTTSTRIANQDQCWSTCAPYAGVPFTIDVNITDGNTHQFSLYLLQWDAGSVQDVILVTDVTHGANLLFHVFNNFNNTYNPEYVRWNISGHVRFTLYYPTGNTDAETFSAYFFDPVTRSAVTSSNSGSYVTTDTLTQGNWTPGSGGDGYLIEGGSNPQPSYVSNFSGNGFTSHTWVASSSDVRAYYSAPASTTRIAGQWFAQVMGNTITMTDGNIHTIAMYFLDWDTTARAEMIYTADATTGALFDARLLTGFHNGTYVVWNLKGNIVSYFVQAGGLNATLSGIFYGTRVPSLTLADAVSPTGNQPPGTVLTYTGTVANIGAVSALNSYVSTAIPANTDFQIGSSNATLTGTGLTFAASYSNNGGGSYGYTPVSAGGGAGSGYDRNVTNVRWTFTGSLSQGAGANTGIVTMNVRIQ